MLSPRGRLAGSVVAGFASVALAAGPAAAEPAAPVSGQPLSFVQPLRGPDDNASWVRAEQWQIGELKVPDAWTYADGSGVTVAVVDSGVDATHPDLQGQVLPGLDLVDPGGDGETDPVGHGTTVSGIVAGRNDDATGVVGIAPKAKILPIRVLDEQNRYGDAHIVAEGVRWAVDHGATVINLSLGGNGSSDELGAALDYAFVKNVVVVACTGNVSAAGSATGVWYPAREPGVIAVAGMDKSDDRLWAGSITGRETVVTAPATKLVGARAGGGYWRVQGTSFAAPMVTATAALIRSRWPDMSAGDVINRIVKTARDMGVPGRDDVFGFGLVNPAAALTATVAAVPANPLDTSPSPGRAGFGSAPVGGQAQSAPDDGQGLTPTSTGDNAGRGASPTAMGEPPQRHGWWLGASLLLISALAALLTVRRFAHTT